MTAPAPEAQRFPIRLFEPLPRVRRELVRYQGLAQGYDCPPKRRHEARAPLDDLEMPVESGRRLWTPEQAGIALDDARWPARCAGAACPRTGGYRFGREDAFVVIGARLMREVRLDAVVAADPVRLDELPVGALYRANESGLPRWLWRSSDGCLTLVGDAWICVTPDGLWWISEVTPDRSGATHRLVFSLGTDRIESVRCGGPAARWCIDDSELRLAEGQPS